MLNLKSVSQVILGNKAEINPERYFLTLVCLASSFFLMLLTIRHLQSGLSELAVNVAFWSALVLLALYFGIRYRPITTFARLFLSVYGLLALDLTWYARFLSLGPVLFFIFAFGALIVWVWHGRALILMLLFYFVNLAGLFLFEYNAPARILYYPDLHTRSIDIYISFAIYSSLLIFILYRVKLDFQQQSARAIASDKMKSAFLANMSHEIRTPLNAIVGFSQIIEHEQDPAKRNKFTKIIQNSSSNLIRLINEIIDLSKIEAGEVTLHFSNTTISELFAELKDIFAIDLQTRNKCEVSLSYSLPDGDFCIETDPTRLRQVLSNLLSNAIKHTSEGSVRFCCSRKGHDLVFNVTDTGTGIPEEDQKRIFERFTKFNYHNNNLEGTGIGLSIVEKIVHLLNGRIWLKSIWGKGSSFSFSIPYTPACTDSAPDISNQKSSDIKPGDLRKTILLVEDDPENTLLVKEFLEPFPYQLHHVADGWAAVSYIREHPDTHLVLMDMKLPRLDGYEATREIKKICPDIIVIAQTAYAVAGDKEKALQAGCRHYLTKPIDFKELIELIETSLDKESV